MGRLINLKNKRVDREKEDRKHLYKMGYVWVMMEYMMGTSSLLEIDMKLEAQPTHTNNGFDSGAQQALKEMTELKLTDYNTKRVVDFAGEI